MNNELKIKELIASKTVSIECLPLVEKYADDIQNSSLSSLSDKGMETHKILYIYERRHQHLLESDIDSEGSEILVECLKKCEEKFIKIALFQKDKTTYTIFIKDNLEKILGLIRI